MFFYALVLFNKTANDIVVINTYIENSQMTF